MMYTELVNEEALEVPVKELLSSLRGPLLSKGENPEVTTVVEYYNLLPYVDILSGWLSRETPHDGSLHVARPQSDVDENYSLILNGVYPIESHEMADKLGQIMQATNTSSTKKSAINGIIIKKEEDPSLSGASYISPSITCSSIEPDIVATVGVRTMDVGSFQRMPSMDVPSDKKNLIECRTENNEAIDAAFIGGSTETLPCDAGNNSIPAKQNQLLQHVEDIKIGKHINLGGHIIDKDLTSNQCGASVPFNEHKDKVAVVDLDKAQTKSTKEEPFSLKKTDDAQDKTAVYNYPHTTKSTSQNLESFHLAKEPKSDILQASLWALRNKLAVLREQQRLFEEEISVCEMSIQNILNGDDVLSSNAEMTINMSDVLNSSQMQASRFMHFEEPKHHENNKRKRLSKAILSLQSPCQELDDLCCANNWTLPRYTVLPSSTDGMFKAYLTIQVPEFEIAGGGDFKCCPREARQSAASHTLSKLFKMADQ